MILEDLIKWLLKKNKRKKDFENIITIFIIALNDVIIINDELDN